mmetsp:Transcript_20771/g.61959  ORF Transcript_20771/g.61959 Transcript_20771/m.61959 type:complete len:367 (-) Transcript_20771:86-1186(-)
MCAPRRASAPAAAGLRSCVQPLCSLDGETAQDERAGYRPELLRDGHASRPAEVEEVAGGGPASEVVARGGGARVRFGGVVDQEVCPQDSLSLSLSEDGVSRGEVGGLRGAVVQRRQQRVHSSRAKARVHVDQYARARRRRLPLEKGKQQRVRRSEAGSAVEERGGRVVLARHQRPLDLPHPEQADGVDGSQGEARVVEERRPRLVHVPQPLVLVIQGRPLAPALGQRRKLSLGEQVPVEVDPLFVPPSPAVEAVRVDSMHQDDTHATARGRISWRIGPPLQQRELDGGAGMRLDAVRARHVHQRGRRSCVGWNHCDVYRQVCGDVQLVEGCACERSSLAKACPGWRIRFREEAGLGRIVRTRGGRF